MKLDPGLEARLKLDALSRFMEANLNHLVHSLTVYQYGADFVINVFGVGKKVADNKVCCEYTTDGNFIKLEKWAPDGSGEGMGWIEVKKKLTKSRAPRPSRVQRRLSGATKLNKEK
jgi:hypothetical protein